MVRQGDSGGGHDALWGDVLHVIASIRKVATATLKDDALGELSAHVTELERRVRRLQLEHQGVSQQLAARVLEVARLHGELEKLHAENLRLKKDR